MDINIENVECALTQFYRTNSALQAEAHQWLMRLQNSTDAWSFVWQLLHPNRSCEAQFFGSNTLHLKIVNNWNEVPEVEYENLKSKLLQTIIAYSSGPKIVLNRLCIALAVYVLRVTPRYWEHSIEDIHNIFRPENVPNIPPERTVWILLEILSVIPDELRSITLINAQRTSVTSELKRASPKVMITLESLLEYNNYEVRSLAAKGINKWVFLGGIPLPECLNVISKLITVIQEIQAVDPFESCEHEIEALCQIMTNPLTQEYTRSILPGLELVLQIHGLLQKSESQDFVTNLYNLYISIGETHGSVLLTHLASNDTRSVQIVQTWLQCILSCLSTPGSFPNDETNSHLVISFWSSLYDERDALADDQKKIVSDLLEPLYKEVCRILLVKSQFPPDNVTLSASEAELLRIYRQDIADTIVNCYLFIRHFFISMLEETLHNSKTWQEVESVLHIVYSLAETTWNCDEEDVDDLDEDNSVILTGRVGEDERKAVITLMINIPPNLINAQVINSLNLAIGVYSEWWICHTDILGCLIPTLIGSLQNTATSTSATMALKDITRECTTSIIPYAPALLDACQDALENKRLHQDESIRIMFSIGKLLSIIPYKDMVLKLDGIVNDYTTDIANALGQPKSDSTKNILLTRLKMLANLCSSIYLSEKVNVDPPVVLILRRLLPLLNAIIEHWSSSAVVIEEVCRCIKSSIVSLVDYPSIPLIEDVVKLALAGYIAQPNTVMLDLTRQLYIMFAKSPLHSQLLVNVIRSVSDTTVSLAMNNKASSSSDVIQLYFTLMNTIGKRNASFLEGTIDLQNLFNFATAALVLPEGPTINSASQLLCMIILHSNNFSRAYMIVNTNGERLVEIIIKCLGSDSTPRSNLSVFSDILAALNKIYCQNLARWLNTVLSRENFPTEKATSEAKNNFVRTVLREKATTGRLLEAVKLFALICRGTIHH